jgi:AcrR family transcriptional regulator
MSIHYIRPTTPADTPAEEAYPTRELLLRTAERLFALNGIEGVTHAQILEAAGQRNASAITYHFGGRDALIRAIIDFRIGPLNQRRMELLDTLCQFGRADDVTALVDALVRPLAEQIEPDNYFVGFLGRVTNNIAADRPAPTLDDPANASLARVGRMLRKCLPDVARPVLADRFAMASDMAIHALALHQAASRQGRRSLPKLEQVIDDLVDAIVGLLSAASRPSKRARAQRAEAQGSGRYIVI